MVPSPEDVAARLRPHIEEWMTSGFVLVGLTRNPDDNNLAPYVIACAEKSDPDACKVLSPVLKAAVLWSHTIT